MSSIGKNIKNLRKQKKMSQEQLAGLLHVTRQAVSNWETSKSQPDIETLEAIAGAFDTDILVVLYGRRQEETDSETRQAQRKQCIRNALLWGALTLTGTLIYVFTKGWTERMAQHYFDSRPRFLSVLILGPACFFAGTITFMNLIGLLGDIRIRQTWARRTVLGISIGILVFYIIAASGVLLPVLLPNAHLFDKLFMGLNHISPLLGYRLAKAPPLFFVSAAGIFLGIKGDKGGQ